MSGFTKNRLDEMIRDACRVDGWNYNDEALADVCCHVRTLAAEIERLQAIVERLPKTADLVPIVIGDSVFVPETQTLVQVGAMSLSSGDHVIWAEDIHTEWRNGRDCYSTLEAAEAAQSEQAIARCESAEKARNQ